MIQIQNLVVQYGALRAVDDLSLSVPAGTLLGLLGPNGAGKTSTLSCVAGLISPDAGKITVGGVDVAASPGRAQGLLGVVPQSLALYGTLSVLANLRLFGGLFGVGGRRLSERVEWALALARLEGRQDALVGELSGGMKRRLNLVAALLHDPQIIICDEPTTGVDPQSRNHLFETIRALHAEGRTIIYTTHYMEEVEALCERVAIMDRGKLLVDEPIEALLRPPEQATDFQLLLDTPIAQRAVLSALRSAGIEGATLAPKGRSLERVFLGLTGRGLRDGGTPEPQSPPQADARGGAQ